MFVTPSLILAQKGPVNLNSDSASIAAVPNETDRTPETYSLGEKWHQQLIFESAKKHPLTPRDVAVRDAVQKPGVDRHRFVRCELRNGSTLIGGILSINDQGFFISQGIMDQERIAYFSLRAAPQYDPAPRQHFQNGLKWTGVVAGAVAAAPIIVLMLPLMATGVIAD